MKPLHRAKVELGYTLTLREREEAKMKVRLSEIDERIAEKQARVDELEAEGAE